VLALSACGTQSSVTPTDAKEPSPEVASTKVAAYTMLAEDFVGFFTDIASPGENAGSGPKSAEEALARSDYEFHDGVTLSEFDGENYRMCFTGPDDTYLTFSVNDGSDESNLAKRTLGVGACNYDDGDVVTSVGIEPVKGQPEMSTSETVKSDAKNVATALETFLTDKVGDETWDSSTMTVEEAMAEAGYELTNGNTITDYEADTDWDYRFCVLHQESGAYATYDSSAGGLQSEGADGSCSFDPADSMGTEDEPASDELAETVLKGEDVAAQIPTLTDFTEFLASV
jgi:hypothetical protein